MTAEQLQLLEHRQLVALAKQRTGENYQLLLAMEKDALVKLLAPVEGTLEPERT